MSYRYFTQVCYYLGKSTGFFAYKENAAGKHRRSLGSLLIKIVLYPYINSLAGAFAFKGGFHDTHYPKGLFRPNK